MSSSTCWTYSVSAACAGGFSTPSIARMPMLAPGYACSQPPVTCTSTSFCPPCATRRPEPRSSRLQSELSERRWPAPGAAVTWISGPTTLPHHLRQRGVEDGDGVVELRVAGDDRWG